jgi:hypothetical protein
MLIQYTGEDTNSQLHSARIIPANAGYGLGGIGHAGARENACGTPERARPGGAFCTVAEGIMLAGFEENRAGDGYRADTGMTRR